MRTFALLVAAVLLSACATDRPFAPDLSLAAGEYTSVTPEIARSGCSVGQALSDNTSRVIHVARADLPFEAPELKSVRKTATGKVVYRMETFGVVRGGDQLALTCIVPRGTSVAEQIATLIARTSDSDWDAVRVRLSNASPTDVSIVPALANALRLAVLPNSRRVSTSKPGRPEAAKYDPYSLATITITATPNYAIISIGQLASFLSSMDEGRHFSKELYANYNLYTAECNEYQLAYQDWQASKDQAEAAYAEMAPILQAIADGLAVGAAELQSQACELVVGKPLCLDWFIATCNVAFIEGDCRNFDANAKFSQSRVQLYINPNTLEAEVKWGTTKVLLPVNCSQPPCTFTTVGVQDSASVYLPPTITPLDENGSFRVRFEWKNNLCVESVANSGIPLPCVSIAGNLEFWKNSSYPGGYLISGTHTKSPALGIYKHDGASYQIVVEKSQVWNNAVTFILGLIFEMQVLSQLPPPIPPSGCYLY